MALRPGFCRDDGCNRRDQGKYLMTSRAAERERMSSIAVRAISQEEAFPAESLFLLVVDGERWVRDLCKEIAGGTGFKVYTADNTRAALRQMEMQPVDV